MDHLQWLQRQEVCECVADVSAQHSELYRLARVVWEREFPESVCSASASQHPVAEELLSHLGAESVELWLEEHLEAAPSLLCHQLWSELLA